MTPELALLAGIAVGSLIVYLLMRHAAGEWKRQAQQANKYLDERMKFSEDRLKAANILMTEMALKEPVVVLPDGFHLPPQAQAKPGSNGHAPDPAEEIRRVRNMEEIREKIMNATGFDPRAATNPHFEDAVS